MTKDDNNKVVKLRQPQPKAAAGVVVDDPINPKSLLNMTDVEQDMFLQSLRDRRMRAVEILRQAAIARQSAQSIASGIRLEKKAEQCEKLLERTTKALDALELSLYSLRALSLQYTDVDITKSPDNVKLTTNNGDK